MKKLLLKTILCSIGVLFSFNSFSNEEIRPTFQEIFSKNLGIEKLNKFLSIGSLTTIKFGLSVNKYFPDKNVSDFLTVEKFEVPTSDQNIKFNVDIAYNITNINNPTVVGHFGFNGDINEGNAKYFAITFQETYPNYNLILIQSSSSNNFGKENCVYNLGGLEDALIIKTVVESFINKNTIKKESGVILLGGSSSSAGLFHGASYLNKTFESVVQGLFLQSGYNDMNSALAGIEYLAPNKKQRKNIPKPDFNFLQKLIVKSMLKSKVNKYYEIECFANAEIKNFFGDEEPKILTYYNLLELSYNRHKNILTQIYNDIYDENINIPLMADYYDMLSLSKHHQDINFRFLWFHAKDDPISVISDVNIALEDLSKSKNFASLIVPNGGHSAYKEVYGDEWLDEVLYTFFESVEYNFI